MPAMGQTVERILSAGSAQNSQDTALLVFSNDTTLLVRGVGATESVPDGQFDDGRRSVLAGESSLCLASIFHGLLRREQSLITE